MRRERPLLTKEGNWTYEFCQQPVMNRSCWGLLHAPKLGRHAEDFYIRKFRRLRPGTREPEVSMLTTRPPKPLTSEVTSIVTSVTFLFIRWNLLIFRTNMVTSTPERKLNIGTEMLNITVRIRPKPEIWSIRRATWRRTHPNHCPKECKGLSYRRSWLNKIFLLLWYTILYKRENSVRMGKYSISEKFWVSKRPFDL
jgi:hypothetical protein